MRLILFDHAEKPVKIITDVLDGHEESEINAAAQLSLTLDMKTVSQADLEATAFIAIPRPHQPNNQFNMYAVQSFSNDDNTYSVTGVDQFNFELAGYGYIPAKRMPNASLADVAKTIFDGTRWRVADQDQVPGSAIYFNYNSRIEGVKKMVAAFGVEVEHYYVVEDNCITDRVVNIKKQVGADTFRRFVYGDNALSVVREEARDSIYTAAVGRGKGEEKTDADGNSTGGYGRKITFADVAWSKAQGNPVDKPAGQEWVELPEATKRWGNPDSTPRTTVLDFEDTTDPAALLQQTYDALVDLARPKVQFRAEVQNIGWLNLGDRVIIVRFDQNIKYKARVYKIDRDILDENQTTVEIGDYLVKSQAEREDDLNNQIGNVNDKTDSVNDGLNKEIGDRTEADEQVKDDAATDAKEKADAAEKNANVRTSEKVQYGPSTPTNDAKEGDTWFKSTDPLGTGYPTTWQMMVFRNGKWEEAFPAGYDKVGQQKTDDFKKTIDDAISAAGFDSAQELFKATSDNSKEITTIKANAKGLQTTVEDNERSAKSQFTQLSTLIDQRVTYGEMSTQISQGVTNGLARISLSVSGGGYLTMEGTGNSSQVYLGGSNVHIDGNTYIENGIIKSAMIDSLDAGKITGGDIRGLNAIYLNNANGSAVMSPGAISTSGSLTVDAGSYLAWAIVRNDLTVNGDAAISGTLHTYGTTTLEGRVNVHSIWINGAVVEVSGGNLWINGYKKTS